MFLSFLRAISKQALTRISTEARLWRLHRRTRRGTEPSRNDRVAFGGLG